MVCRLGRHVYEIQYFKGFWTMAHFELKCISFAMAIERRNGFGDISFCQGNLVRIAQKVLPSIVFSAC